jgi:hypothetical protein
VLGRVLLAMFTKFLPKTAAVPDGLNDFMSGAIFAIASHASEITVRLFSLSKTTILVYKLPLIIVQVIANITFVILITIS